MTPGFLNVNRVFYQLKNVRHLPVVDSEKYSLLALKKNTTAGVT